MIPQLLGEPAPHAAALPYRAAIDAHRLELQRCAACGAFQHPPRVVCTSCSRRDRLGFVAADGRGTVAAATRVERALVPELRPLVPYAVVLVALAEGVVVLSAVVAVEPSEPVPVGLAVRAAFAEVAAGRSLLVFVPDDDRAVGKEYTLYRPAADGRPASEEDRRC